MANVPRFLAGLSRTPEASPAQAAGRAAQEAALAALLGGNLFGRVAMHPALSDVSDEAERGKVLNRAWRRYGTVNSAALIALVAGWLVARPHHAGPDMPRLGRATRRRRGVDPELLVRAKDIAVGAAVVTGLASAAGGMAFAQQAPDGAVPMASGHDPVPDTPPRAARLKVAVNALGATNLAAELAVLGIDALLIR
jgi:hypothetical protein